MNKKSSILLLNSIRIILFGALLVTLGLVIILYLFLEEKLMLISGFDITSRTPILSASSTQSSSSSSEGDFNRRKKVHPVENLEEQTNIFSAYKLPSGLQNVLDRAKSMQRHCSALNLSRIDQSLMLKDANVTADLPAFGIIRALESYQPKTHREVEEWNCQLPPEMECAETSFTVVFMGYRPDRLSKLIRQVKHMSVGNKNGWKELIREVLLVWNGERDLRETREGLEILEWTKQKHRHFRVFFPLKEGFPNDLMNRYHPRLKIGTKAILFYDDDGPFYHFNAVMSAFELWKRNSNAEIGAMARRLDVSMRAKAEKDLLPKGERQWVSNCRTEGDTVKYNYHHFAQTGANMVLPSGSFLHRSFLCFLWHPTLEEIRKFVRDHPVHPDDITVSTIVSHVSGRAPKVYSRRLNRHDILGNSTELESLDQTLEGLDKQNDGYFKDNQPRRRLLWDDGSHDVWARKRESAVDSLLGYFGSINSGSDGWCYGTRFHDLTKNICIPDQAKEGMLSWMSENNQALPCPEYRQI
jgi:Glycosyl transferase family 64 domain